MPALRFVSFLQSKTLPEPFHLSREYAPEKTSERHKPGQIARLQQTNPKTGDGLLAHPLLKQPSI
jgi:hypothetical protein